VVGAMLAIVAAALIARRPFTRQGGVACPLGLKSPGR